MLQYEAAHRQSADNREVVLRSRVCGCFHCLEVFRPERIEEWVDGGRTACCPRCTDEAVLGDAGGYPITVGFLTEMRKHWFGW